MEIKKYSFIDALRGWAILGVILVHTSQSFAPSSALLQKIASQGAFGVQLFYLTSAFTLFLSFNSRQGNLEKKPIQNFYIRRFFRIAPLFYIAIFVYFIKDGFSPRHWAPDGIQAWHVLTTFLFVNGWHPTSINSVVPGCWSVAVEMNFYLFLPFLFRFLNSLNKAIFSVFITLILGLVLSRVTEYIYAPFFPQDQQYLVSAFSSLYSLHANLSIFCLGFVLYFLFKNLNPVNSKTRNKRQSLVYSAIALYMMTVLPFGGYAYIPQHFLYGISFLIFSYALAIYPLNLFVNPVTELIGKLSFSMYLIHFLVIDIASKLFLIPISQMPHNLSFFLAFILVTSLTTLLSKVTYLFIEKPGQRLGKYIISFNKKL